MKGIGMDTNSCAPGVGVDWSVGKNIDTIQFVKLAEVCLTMLEGDAAVITQFREYVDKVKHGEIVIVGARLPLPPLHDFF